jgi:type II secretion system protein N
MIQKILPWLAGAAWGTMVFLGGLQLFFPSDAAVERLQYEVEQASDGGWQLSADSAGLWRATGVKLKGVELLKVDNPRRLRRGADEEEADAPVATRFLVADHIALRAQLLPLLGGSRQASFDAELYRGELSGIAGIRGTSLGTDGQASELDLSLFPFEGETISLDLGGALDASWDLVIDTEDTTKSTGQIALEVVGLVLNSATVAGFDLEESSSFSKAELVLEIEDGKAKVKKGDLVGDLIEAKLDGDITLNKKFDRSRLRLKIEFTLAEHIDNLVKLLPGAKDARRDDGRYQFTISGTILHPSFRAERERRTSSRTKRVTSPTEGGPGILPGGLGGADDDDDVDADERRRLREERIKERRERLRERREEAQAERGTQAEPAAEDHFEDHDEFLDDDRDDFPDEMPMPLDRDFDDVELMDAPFEDEDMGEFEDEF